MQKTINHIYSLNHRLCFLLFAILVLLAVAGVEDWSRLFYRSNNFTLEVSTFSNTLKFFVVMLTVIIAYLAKGKGLSEADEKQFRVIFSAIFLADCCFFFSKSYSIMIGIAIFMVVHFWLIKRNLMGIRRAKIFASGFLPIVATGYILAVIFLITNTIIYQQIGINTLSIELSLYSIFLFMSVMSSLISYIFIKKIPDFNAILMFMGLVFFFFCDITVMGTLVLPLNSIESVFTTSMTWMFYGPALTLIALSSWRRDYFFTTPAENKNLTNLHSEFT